MQRRQVLQTSVATLGAAVGLAGCLSGSSDDPQTRRPDDRSEPADDSESAENVPEDHDADDAAETPTDLTAPPRESAVFAAVEASGTRLLVTFESNPVVESRADLAGTTTPAGSETATNATANATATNATATTENATATATTATTTTNATATATRTETSSSALGLLGDSLAGLVPVGTAAGRSPGRGGGGRSGGGRSGSGRSGRSGGSKSGSGRSGRSGGSKSGSGGSRKPDPGKRGSGASPSRGRNGRYKWRGGAYAAWHDRHAHEVREYAAVVADCGVGYLGDVDATEDALPGARAVEWDRRCDGDHAEMTFEPSGPGWYRVGARLRSGAGDHDFGWEAVDVRLRDGDDGLVVDSQWKVSPRL
ncbi:hypothetical protein [Halorussus caseinilyticus]|uniref:Uncharacterized protein n=1 Tax=Halorussus caseinilyticus TaxID=3034025 RepID=A0ABD5WNW2_9EURY|nr:hypothetical protein [Halorussus sp. DT72]